jgi:hypothetical protein
MTIQAQVSAFGALLLFQSEIEVNRTRKGQALPPAQPFPSQLWELCLPVALLGARLSVLPRAASRFHSGRVLCLKKSPSSKLNSILDLERD